MEKNTLEKAGALATDTLNKIKEPEVKKAAAEATEAAEAKAKADAESKKIEGQKLAEAEAKAKVDEEILGKDEKDLSEPEKTRKAELLDIKRKRDATPEEKIKRVQEASQQRIDEIKSELLDKENKSKAEIARLQAELEEVKKAIAPKIEEDAKAKAKREEAERISKYVDEDKSKPREDRREMSKDDLQAWFLEDPDEAAAWVADRSVRRAEERNKIATQDTGKKLADDFIRKQNESRSKLFAKYPGVNPSKEKLASFAGKSNDEIREALCAESEEFRICTEVVAENPKLLEMEDGPERVMREMEKRLTTAKKSDDKKPKAVTLTEEELEERIQAEIERRQLADDNVSSSTGGKKVERETEKSGKQKHIERIAKKARISMDALNKTIERRKNIPGASVYEEADA